MILDLPFRPPLNGSLGDPQVPQAYMSAEFLASVNKYWYNLHLPNYLDRYN